MFAHQYIVMCKEAKDEIEYIRVFINTKNGILGRFHFQRDDFYHHPRMGENGTRRVQKVEKRILRAIDDPWPYEIQDCVWIPTAVQLIEEARKIPFSLTNLEQLKEYYRDYALYGLSDEERALSYFMEKHEGKTWDFENQEWIKTA
jgi:hypothetical protein